MRAVSSLIHPSRLREGKDGSDSPCAPSSPKSPRSPKGSARALLSYVSGKHKKKADNKDDTLDDNSLRGRAHSADDYGSETQSFDDEVKDSRDAKGLEKKAKPKFVFDDEYARDDQESETSIDNDVSSETTASLSPSILTLNSTTDLTGDMYCELEHKSVGEGGTYPVFEGVSMRRKDRKLSVHAVHPCGPAFITEGVRLLNIYLGLEKQHVGENGEEDFDIEWLHKGLKRGVRVESTMVAGSTWQVPTHFLTFYLSFHISVLDIFSVLSFFLSLTFPSYCLRRR